ncbi:MAG TPA: tetratricopeptide repeat protein [Tahibacter sp.]|uniref:tetratricopeptide repeat protein n=1 Tax=Tahibacter sp. TaxID=2056211 RepID=UPI002C1DC748|nr:tetratricopeptide repeat protein [Tahibacter sp.]HSX62532.1 tetratricopeptide repeat protein [Tahibacter sp.]
MKFRADRAVSLAALAVAAALSLAACTAMPVRQATTQPGQAVVAPTPLADDQLAQMLAGEFALGKADLAGSAGRYARAAELSKDPQVAAHATRVALAAKDWALARQSLTRWRALKPDDPGQTQVEASLALSDGNTEAAFQSLSKLLALPDQQGWRLLGQVLLGAADKSAAATLLRRIATPTRLTGAPEEIWVAMSQLAYKLDIKPYARELADAALKKFTSATTHGWSAQLAIDEGDKARAGRDYQEAIKRAPKDIRLRAAYALMLGQQGDNKAAAKLLADGPQDDYSYAARAAYVARANDKNLIQSLYDELKARPGEERLSRAHLLGQLAEMLERKSEALEWYEQVTTDDEDWFPSQIRIAVLVDEQGKPDQALAMTRELQQRVGDQLGALADAFMLEAELLSKRDQHEAAQAAYARALKQIPDDSRLLYARALHAAANGMTDSAESDLRRVLELKPDDMDATNALGYTLADANRKLDEAMSLIERALKAKPDDAAVIDSYGWVLYRRGDLPGAEKALRRAFEKQSDGEIASHLGEVLWVQGKREEARAIFEQARKKDAKNKALVEAMRRLGV